MHFTFKPRNKRDAHTIAQWHYEQPYTFYDFDQDPEDLEGLLNLQNWQDFYYSVLDEQGTLVGLFLFRNEEDTVEIGIGLRPDLTGKGVSFDFGSAGLAFAKQQFSPTFIRFAVATFNHRAIRLYKKVGFQPGRFYMQKTNGCEYEFLEMTMVAE
jgi:[ribosomal protein S18]-alanine N-acetyltransferase